MKALKINTSALDNAYRRRENPKESGKIDEKIISKRISVYEASKFKSFFTKVTVPLISTRKYLWNLEKKQSSNVDAVRQQFDF
jgi:hypothetical protein